MQITDDMVELVTARVESMPDNLKLNLGSMGSLDKNDILRHVKSQDNLGKRIVENQMQYLQQMIKGFENDF